MFSRHLYILVYTLNEISILEVGFNNLKMLLFYSHALMFKGRNILRVLKMLYQDFRNGLCLLCL